MNEWVSVKDRLPEDEDAKIVWHSEYLCFYMAFCVEGEWFSWETADSRFWCEGISHWMPLTVSPPPGQSYEEVSDE